MMIAAQCRAGRRYRLVDHFDNVCAELGGRFDDNGDLVAHMLEREKFDQETACMIEDCIHNIAVT